MTSSSKRLIQIEPTIGKPQDAFAAGGYVCIVRDEDQSGALRFAQREQQLDDRLPGLSVQVPSRLVCQKQSRSVYQRPGDRHPLLLPARELRRQVGRLSAETHGLQHAPCPPLLLRTYSGRDQRREHVLKRGEHRDQVETLEDKPDLTPLARRIGTR
jgi:hypothetical protein